MLVKNIPIDDIKMGDRFRIDMGNIKELALNIMRHGLIQPITLDEDLNLIAGGRRLMAFKEIREMHARDKNVRDGIPCIIRSFKNEINKREVELYENIHRKDMAWDEKVILFGRIHDLLMEQNGDKHTQIQTAHILGRDPSTISLDLELAEVIKVFPEIRNAANKDQARKIYKKLIEDSFVKKAVGRIEKIRKEEIAKTGKSETAFMIDKAVKDYMIGDMFEGISEVEQGIWNFAEVDPPYGINLKDKKSKNVTNIENYNEVPRKEYKVFVENAAVSVFQALSEDAFCVWWFGSEWYQTVYRALIKAKFKVDKIPCVWFKSGSGAVTQAPDFNLSRSYEPFFICRKGQPPIRQRGRSNVFEFKPVPPKQKTHPTERPTELIQEIYKTFVFPGARIIVPFLGSGASLIAAYRFGTKSAIGWELSKEMKKRFLAKMVLEYGDTKDA